MAFTSKQTAWERAAERYNKQQALDTKEHEELVDARERAEILKLEQFEREERSRIDDETTERLQAQRDQAISEKMTEAEQLSRFGEVVLPDR
jgi:hypothetical protein